MQDMRKIIAYVRVEPATMSQYPFLSTSEFLILCLGVGTSASMKEMDKTMYPTIAEAWKRIGEDGQRIVMEAWNAAP